jgi:hypothetical protein
MAGTHDVLVLKSLVPVQSHAAFWDLPAACGTMICSIVFRVSGVAAPAALPDGQFYLNQINRCN